MTNEWLAALLNDLGTTGDEVADALRRTGIKGFAGSIQDCPIARYINARADEAGTCASVKVCMGAQPGYLATAFSKGLDGQARLLKTRVPEPVTAFIEAFDRAEPRYADLDAEHSLNA